MKSPKWRTSTRPEIALVLAACLSWTAQAPRGVSAAAYMDAKALGKRLKDTAEPHRKLMRVKRVGRSLGERPVWLVELGRGSGDERRTRPAMLVVAGIEGNDLAGCAAAVTWIEHLVEQYQQDDAVREILDTTTIYVFPRLNPDAAEFGTVRALWPGTFVLNTGREVETNFCQLENLADWGVISAATVGRAFLANPDLIDRLRQGAELTEPDVATFYSPGPAGYTDYPTLTPVG